jgi:hypothetical protein
MRVRINSVVTPIVPVNRTTMGKPYRVIRVADKTSFIIIDDFDVERMCYVSDFKHYYFNTFVILSVLGSIVGLLSYFYLSK